jgi:hypothetical protein
MEGISLGWNCESASKGVEEGLRKRKGDGYTTCPFDECVTNYKGILECLKDDFRSFCDPSYLKLIVAPYSTGGIVKGERLLFHTKYQFIFNHESPDHANLYQTQGWSGGKDHYIRNNYELFIERYSRRIDNFKRYMENNTICFILGNFDNTCEELDTVLKTHYPSLLYRIIHFSPNCTVSLFNEHHKLMTIDLPNALNLLNECANSLTEDR